MLAGSKRMLSLFEDFELQSNGTQIDRMQSFKYLGVTMDSKWSWKPHNYQQFAKETRSSPFFV